MPLGRSASSQPSFLSRPSIVAVERYILRSLGQSRNQLLLLWLVGGTTAVALFVWNWRLMLAASAGIGATTLAYQLQQQDLMAVWRNLNQRLQGPQRLLAIAVLSGGATAFSTYVMASVWAATENHWLATASVMQGAGVLGILALVSWQAMQRPLLKVDRDYDRLLWNLTTPSPLKRLMAVRQLARHYRRYTRSQQTELQDYFLMLLDDEAHPKVRSGLLSAIEHCQDHQRDTAPLQMPLRLQKNSPEAAIPLEAAAIANPTTRSRHHRHQAL